MAKTTMLFERVEDIRVTVKHARDDLNRILLTMRRSGKPLPRDGGLTPAHDLFLQLSSAYTALDEAYDYLTPMPGHIDQKLQGAALSEVGHG
jgi:hypothetical protein